VLAAWATLWLWSASPYARYLDHGRWTEVGFAAALCKAIPAGDFLLPAALYAAAWVLMIAAMMLPSTLPVLRIFRRVVEGNAHSGRLNALLIAGYLAAWFGFGVAAHMVDWALNAAARQSSWFITHGWLVGVAVVGLAGLSQFSALKYRCLDKCRAPYAFVAQRWRGRHPSREAWRIGFDHGLFCVGCCWALMLLMFVVGMANIGWMLALAGVMAAEKNLPGGARFGRPFGAALLVWAGAIAFVNT
jgi:predicted metal-binding membrane protein